MTTDTKPTATITPTAPIAKPPRKSALVLKLLNRTKGATVAEIAEPTGWQPHSTRAYLSNLRKQGRFVVREQRKTGETAYRVIDGVKPATVAAGAPVSETLPVLSHDAVGTASVGERAGDGTHAEDSASADAADAGDALSSTGSESA